MDSIQLLNWTFGDGVSWKTTVTWKKEVPIMIMIIVLARALARALVQVMTMIIITMEVIKSSPTERARKKLRIFSKQKPA